MISIYTDGSSCGRILGPGGWAWVCVVNGVPVATDSGGWELATNNQMEMQAAIEGLAYAVSYKEKHPDAVELVSDSQYTLGIANGKYSPTKNLEQCQKLTALFSELKASARWIPGHSGDTWNERCDSLAKRQKEILKKAEVEVVPKTP